MQSFYCFLPSLHCMFLSFVTDLLAVHRITSSVMDLLKEDFCAYIFIELQRGRKPSQIYKQLQETNVNFISKNHI